MDRDGTLEFMQQNRDRAKIELSQWLAAMGVSWDGDLSNLQQLSPWANQLTSLPESIGQLSNLRVLCLRSNQLTSLPESIVKLTYLDALDLSNNKLTRLPESLWELNSLSRLTISENQLTRIPESIGRLTNLYRLNLSNNHIHSLPESIEQLSKLRTLYLDKNPLTDLSPLQTFVQEDVRVSFLGVDLPRRYRTKLSDWQPEWLLDENNAEVRRVLIQQLGYERVSDVLGASAIDTWREYTLLKIDNIEAVYEDNDEPIDREPMLLLKMTCPSTEHIHMLRVPPDLTSAEAAITWVNHGIHPDEFAIQT